jgi:hypothetical protein
VPINGVRSSKSKMRRPVGAAVVVVVGAAGVDVDVVVGAAAVTVEDGVDDGVDVDVEPTVNEAVSVLCFPALNVTTAIIEYEPARSVDTSNNVAVPSAWVPMKSYG